MINRNSKGKWPFLVAAVMAVTALLVSVVVFSAKRQEPKQQHPKDWLSSIPRTMSKVKDLEIINARIVRPSTDAPGVAFEIRNNSNRAVMAVHITSGESGISKDGNEDEENPTVIIEPYGTLTAEMNDELTRDAPIVIDAATFADGTEEGDETTLKFMHKIRVRERARHRAEKQRLSTERKPNQ
ncbi:MAG: hypothetical protein ACR2LM_15495 [Pyrinomonadaceae bacterium]